ncbi:membrane protein [Sulfolobus virus STSV1]|uniref:membrane protein n=1 Tax=Sulfolobus virus STSV1 TaxID=285013 RepID=UPI000042B12E|nr:membrane protein [Sulfolobus virus STSV1]CAH04247.1 integral membrane protein [Sulfolobus virus STSV1]
MSKKYNNLLKEYGVWLIFAGAFAAFYTLVYQQYVTMEAFPIYDVGVNLMFLYLTAQKLAHLNNPLTWLYILATFAYKSPLLYFFFINNAYEAVIWQAAVTAAPIIPLFYIAKELTKSYEKSYLVVWLYLLNPGVYGELFMPFHMQNLFVLYFLLMYYFKIKNKPIPAAIFAILASTVRFPYVFLVLLYINLELFVDLFKGFLERRYSLKFAIKEHDPRYFFTTLFQIFARRYEFNEASEYIMVAAYGALMFIPFGIAAFGHNAFNIDLQSHLANPNGYSNIGFNPLNLLTPLTILASVFFVWDWFILTILPVFVFFAITTYQPMTFPYIYLFQYASLYLAQLFITVARTLAKIDNFNLKRIMSYALLFVLLTFAVLSLISPLSITSRIAMGGPYYTLAEYPDRVQYFYQVASLIPQNASVLTTPYMPELYPRIPEYLYPLVLQYTNFTSFNFAKNQYLVYDPANNTIVNVSVDYIIIDITNNFNNQSIAVLNLFYKNGYGIYAVCYWFVVMKYNYSGPPVLFKPPSFSVNGTTKLFLIPGIYTAINAKILGITNNTVETFGYYNVVGNNGVLTLKSVMQQ